MKNSKIELNMGIISVVFIVFLVLKLFSVIAWSWWWVTAPIWISLGVGFIILIIVVFFQYYKREVNT